MRSLQWKFTLALLFTSLTAVLLVGVVARGTALRKFNQNAMESSFNVFRGQLGTYISSYGSWDKAQRVMPLRDWMQAHRSPKPAPRDENAAPPPASADGAPAPPPPAPPRDEPGANDGGNFRFVVLDPAGHVLLGPPEMRGNQAPSNWRTDAKPVMVNGRVEVLVVPYGEANLSRQDTENLNSLGAAIWRGVALAMLLALGLGLLLGHQLNRKLRELTRAIQAMGQGELRQRVEIHSRDEIGVLAGAFNSMSQDLALAHDKLQQSHEQITHQAAQLRELSIRDGLTKLFNRRHFDDQLRAIVEQSTRYNRPLTVMIGDIDHFKKINDTFSHATGDEVLRHVSAILQKATRQSDIVARYGGEEFVIAFPETDLDQTHAFCERLRAHIENYDWQRIHPGLRVSMSMGLCADLSLGSAEKMVAAADELLYYAKEHGRNRVCTSSSIREELSATLPIFQSGEVGVTERAAV